MRGELFPQSSHERRIAESCCDFKLLPSDRMAEKMSHTRLECWLHR